MTTHSPTEIMTTLNEEYLQQVLIAVVIAVSLGHMILIRGPLAT